MAVNGAGKAPGFFRTQALKAFAYLEEFSGSTYKRLSDDTVSLTTKPTEEANKPKSWMQSIKDKFNEHFPPVKIQKVDGEDITRKTIVGWCQDKWKGLSEAFSKPYVEKQKRKTETPETGSVDLEARGDMDENV